MKCANCERPTSFKPSVEVPEEYYVIEMSNHGEEEKWAKYCSKCEKFFCGPCCFPRWQALKAKEGLSGMELAAKLERDPDAYFSERPTCPLCGEWCELQEPKKAGCFIATVAFGSSTHDEVVLLQQFRDQYLKQVPWGRALISLYYKISPSIARFIRNREILRAITRNLFLGPLTKLLKKFL